MSLSCSQCQGGPKVCLWWCFLLLNLLPCYLQGDFAAAASNLQTCLSVLGRALPASRLDLACSLSWNVIRYSLQKLALVRWLLKRTSHQWRAREATAGFEDEAKTSARDAALAYHKLHQLHITGRSRGGRSAVLVLLNEEAHSWSWGIQGHHYGLPSSGRAAVRN